MNALAIDQMAEGLFGIFMAFVILAGMIGLAWGAAVLIAGRDPKCQGCGWRQGHRPDCRVLDRLVGLELLEEMSLFDEVIAAVRSGQMTRDEAMAALNERRRKR